MSYLRPDRFEVIAHRGGGHEVPENTLTAFEHAAGLYPDIIFELDVHLTRDGQVVVIHDPTVDRTTNGTGAVRGMTYSEISRLDGGYRFTTDGGQTFPFRGKGVRHPLLSEVFEKFPHCRVSVELKHRHPLFEEKVVEIIRQARADNRTVLAAEDHQILKKLRKQAPNICSGFSSREVLRTLIANHTGLGFLAPRAGKVIQIPLNQGAIRVFSPKLLQKAHRRGQHVHLWTINDEATMRYLLEQGVDGIITDAPSLLLRVARTLKKI